MLGPYVHAIDPILADVGALHLWWYGLGFALGFLEIHLFLGRGRAGLGLTQREVWSLSLFIVVGVLAGGRLVEVSFDEWPFYRAHPWLVPAYWLGGMATHGLLLGAAAAVGLFAWAYKKPFLPLADALVIPGAFLMGLGRLGNFIDGQIVGRVTDVWWAVKFPDAEGFRHPVVLYDGAKNLLLMLFLMRVRKTIPDPRCHGRAVRVLVRRPAHRHRPVSRLSHAPARPRHRADAQHRHGGARPGAALSIAPEAPGTPPGRAAGAPATVCPRPSARRCSCSESRSRACCCSA